MNLLVWFGFVVFRVVGVFVVGVELIVGGNRFEEKGDVFCLFGFVGLGVGMGCVGSVVLGVFL